MTAKYFIVFIFRAFFCLLSFERFLFFSFHEVYDGARIRRKPVVVSTDEGGWSRERAAVNCTFSSISHGKRWINRISPKGIRGGRVMVAAPLGTEPHLVYSTVEWDTGISADKFKLSFRWHEKAGRQNVEADAQHKNTTGKAENCAKLNRMVMANEIIFFHNAHRCKLNWHRKWKQMGKQKRSGPSEQSLTRPQTLGCPILGTRGSGLAH